MHSVCKKSANSTGMTMTVSCPFAVRVLIGSPVAGRPGSSRRSIRSRGARERGGIELFDIELQLPPPGVVDAQRRRIPVGIAEDHHYPASDVKQILIRRRRVA